MGGLADHQVGDDLGRLVLDQAVLRHQTRQLPGIETSGHVVAGRNRTESAGVVHEAGGPREPHRFGHCGPETPDRVGGVEEPPRHPDVHRRVEPSEGCELAGPDRLVDGEDDQMESRMSAVALQQRAQSLGDLDVDRDVRPHVGAEAGGCCSVMVAAYAAVK